ncbi:MAG: twin-arginine translocase TatA/TatE family subunit [Gemmataceae bacterium]
MSLFAIFGLGPMEIAVVVVLAVLLFGKKLPDVGRYVGKSITEFRKGMKGLEDDVGSSHAAAPGAPMSAPAEPVRAPQKVAATAPKFDDSPAQPQV